MWNQDAAKTTTEVIQSASAKVAGVGDLGFIGFIGFPETPYPLIKEYSLNYSRPPNMI